VSEGAVGCTNSVCTVNWFRGQVGDSCRSPVECSEGLYCKYGENTSVCASGTADVACTESTVEDPCITSWKCEQRLVSYKTKVRSGCTAQLIETVTRTCMPCLDAYMSGEVCEDHECLPNLLMGLRCLFSDVDDSACGARNTVGKIAEEVDSYTSTSAGSAVSWSGALATAATAASLGGTALALRC